MPGHVPSTKPPVRIFLGTQAEQYRPERVFFWSIQQVRDPSRTYEIYLMKRMSGFRGTQFWNTGFTNYRFAIPYYAGYEGRAIYNDVDQTYHVDPAELFDMDMNGHAVLAVSRTDTSVMLMDCESLKKYWPIEKVHKGRKYPLIGAVQAVEGAFGPLDSIWNVRHAPYVPGESKIYHYTILQYQPWRPLRERFYYLPDMEGGPLWNGLEEDADRAGYQVHTLANPSTGFATWCEKEKSQAKKAFAPPMLQEMASDLSSRSGAETTLHIGADQANGEDSVVGSRSISLLDFMDQCRSQQGLGADGVVIHTDLSLLPKDDLPWLIDSIFSQAKKFVVVAVPVPEAIEDPRRLAIVKAAEWWTWAFQSAATHYGEVHWRIALMPHDKCEIDEIEFCRGGKHPTSTPPTVWILSDEKPGHTTQSLGLANELGWPFVEKKLQFNSRGELPNRMVKGSTASLKESSDSIDGPDWPDLLIATGRRTVPIAEWIRQHSMGRTRTVQMGRIGTSLDDRFDIGVAPAYAGLFPDPRRLETSTPLTRVNAKFLAEAADQWCNELIRTDTPCVALLVGGTNAEHEFSPACAHKLGQAMRAMAQESGGEIYVSTSRRTSPAASEALLSAIGDVCTHSHVWSAGEDKGDNPYMGYLALADAFVVTGESASMLAEACTTGKPVAIFPLPKRSAGVRSLVRSLGRNLGDSVARVAYSKPLNKRGIERPQRGVQKFCAGLLARGLVRTGGHSQRLHESLVSRGLAEFFAGKMPQAPSAAVDEVRRVALRVRESLCFDNDPEGTNSPAGKVAVDNERRASETS